MSKNDAVDWLRNERKQHKRCFISKERANQRKTEKGRKTKEKDEKE